MSGATEAGAFAARIRERSRRVNTAATQDGIENASELMYDALGEAGASATRQLHGDDSISTSIYEFGDGSILLTNFDENIGAYAARVIRRKSERVAMLDALHSGALPERAAPIGEPLNEAGYTAADWARLTPEKRAAETHLVSVFGSSRIRQYA